MNQPNRLAGVKHILAVHSAKGGVGKSTLTVNLAVGLAQRGARVGLLDADVHGPSAPLMLGNQDWPDPGGDETAVKPLHAHGIRFISMGNITNKQTPLIWRGAMVTNMLNQFFNNVEWGELDYLLIDMPPGTGDAQITIAQGFPLSGAIVVTTPQELSLADTIRGARAFQKLKVPLLGLIENMSMFVCDDCGETAALFGESDAEGFAKALEMPLLGRIPLEPAVCEGADTGQPVILAKTDSAAARAMAGTIDRLLEAVETRSPGKAFDLSWRDMNWDERYPEPPAMDVPENDHVQAIWQVSNDELGIQWRDGKVSLLSARAMRLACPCATCVDEWTGDALLDPATVPGDIRFDSLRSVGRYAVAPKFSDGHGSGIYTFDRLRNLAQRKSPA